MGMSEEPLTLEVPRWVWPLVVLALLFTAWAALYIYLGPLATGPVVAAAIVAFAFWMATTYRQPRARRVLPGYIVLLIVLVLQGMIFVVLLVSETFYGRIPFLQPKTGDRT